MAKKPEIFLGHILAAIDAISLFLEKINKEDFYASDEKQSAVIRKFEIIGEAIRNIPASLRKKYPEIAWAKACGMRNKAIHEYFGLDMHLIWKTAKNDLPILRK